MTAVRVSDVWVDLDGYPPVTVEMESATSVIVSRATGVLDRIPLGVFREHYRKATKAEVLLHQRVLGSDAAYERVGEDSGGVTLRVVRAPGLVEGFEFRVTRAAAERMETR